MNNLILNAFIFTVVHNTTGNKLRIACDNNNPTEKSTTTTILETTRLSTDITTAVPIMMTKYINHLSATTFETNELTFATFTNTDVLEGTRQTRQTSQQQIDQGNHLRNIYIYNSLVIVLVSVRLRKQDLKKKID